MIGVGVLAAVSTTLAMLAGTAAVGVSVLVVSIGDDAIIFLFVLDLGAKRPNRESDLHNDERVTRPVEADDMLAE